MWWLLLLPLNLLAQDSDLSAIQDLDELLPDEGIQKEATTIRNTRDYRPPVRKVKDARILASGTDTVHIMQGKSLIRLRDSEKVLVKRAMNVKAYRLADEWGFRYLVDKTGKVTYKTHLENITPIKEELVLYEPPHRYTPAPRIIYREYDRKLNFLPEAIYRVGVNSADYMEDLFEETSGSGVTQQFGLQGFTEWKLPVKVGAALIYESTLYKLPRTGQLDFRSFSLGPQVKTRDFFEDDFPLRLQLQLRLSPYARAVAQKTNTETRFNTTDLLVSLEHPIRNSWGSFVVGPFYQVQWLNIKGQEEIARLQANNKRNSAVGLSLSQVFE